MSHERQTAFPYLVYADAPAAIEFLGRAFGFEERSRHAMPDGRVGHAELALEGGVLMLASVWKEMGFASPQDLPGTHAQVYWVVEDVDAHFERARAGGAVIAAEPVEEHGSRMYRALDPEGHRWLFATPIGDPPGR
ncbi:MAG TPA: VOC family protein [Myxococcota bacterium]|nr:VOC family protein [Myxococcota bacterium]